MAFTVQDLAKKLGIPFEGDGEVMLEDVRPLDVAQASHVSFLDNPKYAALAKKTQAGAVIIHPKARNVLPEGIVALVSEKPYVTFAQALALFHPDEEIVAGVSGAAVVSGTAKIHPTARVEPGAVIYAGATVGEGTLIGAHTVVGAGVVVGAHCRIAPLVTLLHCDIGDHALVHSGVRVGQDGFGFAQDGGDLIKVPQVGRVRVGNHVEIGANTTIDRGAMADTVIEDHVKIDCLVQIGHNAKIGHHSRIVAQVGISGSTELGAYCVIGGQSGVAGHLKIADKVMLAARSGMIKSVVDEGAVLGGYPAMPLQQWRKLQALLSRMSKAAKLIKNPALVDADKVEQEDANIK